MEPYVPKQLKLSNELNPSLIKLLCDAEELYGEYKGFLKSMPYDYKLLLESLFTIDTYYSFKIDGLKYTKEDIFYIKYMEKDNNVIQFQNMKKSFLYAISNIYQNEINIDKLNKIHKLMLSNCKKDNLTKGSGNFRKKQTYILKPGIAGSSVSFIPPRHTNIKKYMEDLCDYFNKTKDIDLISTSLTHLELERLHPYITANGKLGRLLFPVQISTYKKEPPILFISESLENLKNSYFTGLSNISETAEESFIKLVLECVIDTCTRNIKKIKKLNKIYTNDLEAFKTAIGGTTIYKVYPSIIKNIVFTTNDIVEETGLHINSVNKVLKKLVETGYLHKEKRKGTNRVTFTYTNMFKILTM